jgi:hypothetical protein
MGDSRLFVVLQILSVRFTHLLWETEGQALLLGVLKEHLTKASSLDAQVAA